MADEPIPAAAPAPASDPAPAPAPARAADPAPAPAPQPAPEPAPAPVEGAPAPAEAPAAEPEFKPHTDTPTAMELIGKDSVKPEEPKPGDPPKPEAAPAPAYEFKPYQLPEGIKISDDARLKTFNDTLTQADLDPQARGQALMDLHISELTDFAKFTAQEQHRIFAEMRKDAYAKVKSDPELGGAGHDTVKTVVAEFRDRFLKTPAEVTEFNDFLRVTGAGDMPAFWRMLYRAGRQLKEPSPRPQGTPPPDIGRQPGGTKQGRLSTLYDHKGSDNQA